MNIQGLYGMCLYAVNQPSVSLQSSWFDHLMQKYGWRVGGGVWVGIPF